MKSKKKVYIDDLKIYFNIYVCLLGKLYYYKFKNNLTKQESFFFSLKNQKYKKM